MYPAKWRTVHWKNSEETHNQYQRTWKIINFQKRTNQYLGKSAMMMDTKTRTSRQIPNNEYRKWHKKKKKLEIIEVKAIHYNLGSKLNYTSLINLQVKGDRTKYINIEKNQ